MRLFGALLAVAIVAACTEPRAQSITRDAPDAALRFEQGDFMSRRYNFRDGRRSLPTGTASAAGLRAPDHELRGDDAIFSGSTMTSWPAVHGPSMTPVATREPQLTALRANGHIGVRFPSSGARCESTGAIIPGTAIVHTKIWVIDPDHRAGLANRRYLEYVDNNSTSADVHLVFAHSANQVAGFNRIGAFYGSDHLVTWRNVNVLPENRLHFFASVLDPDGSTRFYRNRTLAGTATGILPDPISWSHTVIGGSYQNVGSESSVSEWFSGYIYHSKTWVDTALTEEEIFDQFDTLSATYGFTASDYRPDTNSSSLTLWLDSSGKRKNGGGLFDGTTVSQWDGGDATGRYISSSTYPDEGGYINGRPTLRTDANNHFAGGYNVQGTLSAASGAAYSLMTVVTPKAITSTQATAVDMRDSIFGDVGDYFTLGVYSNSGTPSVSLYHWSTGSRSVSDSGIAIDTPVLIHVWYDGSALYLRVGDRTAVSYAAPGNLSAAGNFRLGWGNNSAAKFDGDIAEVIFRNASNTTHMDQDRAYLGALYNVAY